MKKLPPKLSMKKLHFVLAVSLVALSAGGYAYAETEQKPPRKMDWEFEGIFGKVDKQAAQPDSRSIKKCALPAIA